MSSKNAYDSYNKQSAPQGKKRGLPWWAVLAALLVLVYIGVQLAAILAPQMQYSVAIYATMDEYIETEGFVALESVTVPHSAGYTAVYYVVQPGSRVSAGQTVAEYYADDAALGARRALDAINAEISQLEAAQQTAYESGSNADAFFRQRQQGVYNWLAMVQAGDYGGLADARAALATASNKLAVITSPETTSFEMRLAYLYGQKTEKEALAHPAATLTAPVTGYFVPSGHYDRSIESSETLAGLSAGELQQRMQQPPVYYPDEIAGHIITRYQWRYVAAVPADYAGRLATGSALHLTFPDYGDEMVPVTVGAASLDGENGLLRVELLCEYINPHIVKMRLEKACLVLRTEGGLRVEKSALRIVNGQEGVYIRYGSTIYFRRIDIVMEDEFYYITRIQPNGAAGASEKIWLEMYDEMIVDAGGAELYDQKAL